VKHGFSVVNSENALEKALEQKTKGLEVPDYRIAQRRTKSGEEKQERVRAPQIYNRQDSKVANGPRFLEWTKNDF